MQAPPAHGGSGAVPPPADSAGNGTGHRSHIATVYAVAGVRGREEGGTLSAGTAERPPDWILHLSRPVLDEMFGTTTVRRGALYQGNMAVRTLSNGPDGAVVAAVRGGRMYTTRVAARSWGGDAAVSDSTDLEIVSECSCPMGDGCKHVVAVILEAQARAKAQTGAKPTARGTPADRATTRAAAGDAPSWEALLAPVVRGSESASQPDAGATPLALLVDVTPGSSWGRQPGAKPSPRLQLRPMVPGAAGGWIRSGIGWSDIQYPSRWRPIDPAHREALAAIQTAETDPLALVLRQHGPVGLRRGRGPRPLGPARGRGRGRCRPRDGREGQPGRPTSRPSPQRWCST